MTEEVAGVDFARMDNDGGKAQEADNDGVDVTELQQLIAYVKRPWVNKRTIGPERLTTGVAPITFLKAIMQHFDAALKWLIQIYIPSCRVGKPPLPNRCMSMTSHASATD